MQIEDFIFHFTDIFFSELVKETIVVENWEGSDFDVRYRDYIKAFAEIKHRCYAGDVPDKTVFNTLNTLTHFDASENKQWYIDFITITNDFYSFLSNSNLLSIYKRMVQKSQLVYED